MFKNIILSLLITIISFNLTFASSGRTNSSGCHSSKKEGYHCHDSNPISSYTPSDPAGAVAAIVVLGTIGLVVVTADTIYKLSTKNSEAEENGENVVFSEDSNEDITFIIPENYEYIEPVKVFAQNKEKFIATEIPIKPLSVKDKLQLKIERDIKIEIINKKLKSLFGTYLGERKDIHSSDALKINNDYLFMNFKTIYAKIEKDKVISIFSKTNVANNCNIQTIEFKNLIINNFGTHYTFKENIYSYVLNYENIIFMFKCKDENSSFMIKNV